jgi:Cd2+/Zn2+-exporting ATPase/Cu+-exporting ATPase
MSTQYSTDRAISESHAHEHEHAHEHHDAEHLDWLELGRIAFVGVAVLVSWFRLWRPMPNFDVVGFAAALIGGYPIFREAFADLMSRRMTMELSMTIALAAALAIREVFTALVIVFFVLIAEVLEELTVGRGRRAIRDLLDLLPHTAEIRRGEGHQTANMSEIASGDVVLIRPGSRVPVDGEVVHGNSFVDQATITGESLPVEKLPGSEVFAGTINQSGVLEVRVSKVGRNTAFGKIIEAVERAEQSRAPVQRLADRLAAYLVYFALAAAALTFLVTRDVRSTISVIIVAGACGIAAGTPLAILGAIGQAARKGAIIKGGIYLEHLSSVDTVVLDKTGTLTHGKAEVIALHPVPGVTPEELLRVAASAERFSEHPLGKAIVQKAAALHISMDPPEDFVYLPGRGIHCWVNGVPVLVGSLSFLAEKGVTITQTDNRTASNAEIFVAHRNNFLGTLEIADTLRSSAVAAMRGLKQMGIRTVLLTGDNVSIAKAIGNQLFVDEVEAELLPADKQSRVQQMRSTGRMIAMVGDGINDAPALMEANVGVAMGSGTDVARESANVLLLGNDLAKFVDVLRIARRCNRIIMTNFAGTLLVDAAGIGLAMFGFLNPILAALIHVTSELIFILNSARLLQLSRESRSNPISAYSAIRHGDTLRHFFNSSAAQTVGLSL